MEKTRREEWLEDMREYEADRAVRGDTYIEGDYPFLDRRGYIFDLDWGENVGTDMEDDDESDEDLPLTKTRARYSVDAWAAGMCPEL